MRQVVPFVGAAVAIPLVALQLGALASGPADGLDAVHGGTSWSSEPSATGSIVGVVSFPTRATRRVPQRYPVGTPSGPREQPPIPAVAYVEGPPGSTARTGYPSDQQLVQRDTTFHPSLLIVPVGGTAAFPNDDPFFHNVFSYSAAARFDLGRYPQRESKSVTFTEAGYVKVFCEIHDWMRSAVLVVENPFYALVDDDGRFSIDGIPPGRHTLVVTDFEHGTRTVAVEVPDGAAAQVSVTFEE